MDHTTTTPTDISTSPTIPPAGATVKRDREDPEEEDRQKDETMDLYDDLNDTKLPPSSSLSTVATTTGTTTTTTAAMTNQDDNEKPKSLLETIDELQKQVHTLQIENKTLRRNIGTLYRTAKSQLSRKDEEIARLMEELDQTKR